MTDPQRHRLLFAYGTLRRLGPMHALIEGDARFVGAARMRGRLYDLGAYPGVTDSRSRRDAVHGELYELDDARRDAVLESLDRYEGAKFERALREVEAADRRRYQAFVYIFLGNPKSGRPIRSGDYIADFRGSMAPYQRMGGGRLEAK